MKCQVALMLALLVAVLTAGCGGSGQPSCRVYDQRSAAYVSFTGQAASQKIRAFCRETTRAFSNIFGHKWSEQQNPNIDYSHDVRLCGKPAQMRVDQIDVYDSRSGSDGHRICRVLRHNPFG